MTTIDDCKTSPSFTPSLVGVILVISGAVKVYWFDHQWAGIPEALVGLFLLFRGAARVAMIPVLVWLSCGVLALVAARLDSSLVAPPWITTRFVPNQSTSTSLALTLIPWTLSLCIIMRRRRIETLATGLVVFLITSWLSSAREFADATFIVGSLLNANSMKPSVGWPLPSRRVVDRDGQVTDLRSWLRPGDGVMIFSPQCGFCHGAASSWTALDQKLRSGGGRLVLLASVRDWKAIEQFIATHSLTSLAVVAVETWNDWKSLGINGTPHYLLMGEGLHVIWQTAALRPRVSFLDACDLVGQEVVANAILQRLSIASPPISGHITRGGNCLIAELPTADTPNQKSLKLIAASTPTAFPDRIEAAVVLDGVRIVEVREIVWDAGLFDGAEPGNLACVIGMTLEEGIKYATAQMGRGDAGVRSWHTIAAFLYAVQRGLNGVYETK